MREQCGTMLPKQPTKLGSLVKLGQEAAPAPRGGDWDALGACGGRFPCSMRVRLSGGGGSGMAIYVFYAITCVS